MNRIPKRKLVLEPKLRGGGWKATEVEFRFRGVTKPSLESVKEEHEFNTFDDLHKFANTFFKMQYRLRAYGEKEG